MKTTRAWRNVHRIPWARLPRRLPVAPRAVMRYGAALAIECIAILITLAMVTIVPGYSLPGAWELVAVAIIAVLFGLGPGVFGTVAGALLLEYAVLPPQFTFKAGDHTQWTEIASFVLAGLVLSLVITAIEKRYHRALAIGAQARARADAARETTAQIEEFLSIASHEMRSPLTYILGTTQLVERKLSKLGNTPNAQANEKAIAEMSAMLRRAQGQVRVQDRLIGDLLDMSRLRTAGFTLNLAPCDLGTIVDEVVETQRIAWPNREITLDVAADGSLKINADEQRIAQVLTNFVTNALKYSAPEAPVAVRVERGQSDGESPRVLVRDAGPGLSAADREHIWERFHRVPGVKQRDGQGTSLGLGLHISRAIIERHGGQIGVESEVGQGSTFWFTLPPRPATAPAPTRDRHNGDGRAASEARTPPTP